MSRGLKKLLCTAVVFTLLITSNALAQKPEVTISTVSVNFDTETIIITGENFNIGPDPTTVSLGGFGNLNILSNDGSTIVAQFPPGGIPAGDYVLSVSSGPGPKKNDEQSITIGNQGPEGEMGDQGDQGEQGEQGPTGPQGSTGPQGPQGPVGPQGDTGPQGEQGEPGADGADGLACWDLNGNGACDIGTEDVNLPTPDGVCDTLDCQGEQGPTGPQGSTGPQGPQGLVGPQGDPASDTNASTICAEGEVLLGGAGGCLNLIDILCDLSGQQPKTVFVTSLDLLGDLLGEAKTLFPDPTTECGSVATGLEGADCICQELAEAAELSGTYKAWLSDRIDSPSTTFTRSMCPYLLVDGTVVAFNWSDLTDGNIQNAIRRDEKGVIQSTGDDGDSNSGEFVKTNTKFDGTSLNGRHCDDWTSSIAAPGIGVGDLDRSDAFWTKIPGTTGGCASPLNHYCFEQ